MKRLLIYKVNLLCILLTILVFVTCFSSTYSEEVLDNGVQVEPNTELTYYLDIYYDGVDKKGVQSNDSTTAEITSSVINISDKLPAGLTFERFVGTAGDQIGAVLRSDETVGCLGYVVDGYNGLTYDAASHTVSFQIKNMQAGCKITVGIVTKTPSQIDDPSTTGVVETRRDFYNTADGSEGEQSIRSNTVHVWMGEEGGNLYTVRYQYDGSEPVNAPALPTSDEEFEKYSPNSIVSVAAPISVEGYDFEWTTTDVTVTDGQFTMPEKVVTFTGKFTRKASNKVVYQLSSTDNPAEYVLPGENGVKEYYVDSTVTVDSLKAGDVINGYKFLGWTTTDVTVTDGIFTMPNKQVTFTGAFEKIKYNVSYAFQGSVLPPNSDTYLPETKAYAPGETVTIEQLNYTVVGYEFVGWYSEDSFVMPEEDVVIYGEWVIRVGYFEPTITISAPYLDYECRRFDTSEPCYISPRNSVYLETTVTNNETFPIYNVVVDLGYYSNCYYIEEDNVECTTLDYDESILEIAEIPAGGSVTISGDYYSYDSGKVVVPAEIVGALADNNYVLTEKEYIAEQELYVKSVLTICNNLEGLSRDTINQYIVQSDDFTTYMIVKDASCGSIFIGPGSYTITQLDKQDYAIDSVEGVITSNKGTLVIPEDNTLDYYQIIYNNKIVNDKWFRLWDRESNLFENSIIDPI